MLSLKATSVKLDLTVIGLLAPQTMSYSAVEVLLRARMIRRSLGKLNSRIEMKNPPPL